MAIAVTHNAGSIVLLVQIDSNKCHSILLLGFFWIISTPYSVCSWSSVVRSVSSMSVVTLCVGSSIGGVLRGASLQLALKLWDCWCKISASSVSSLSAVLITAFTILN